MDSPATPAGDEEMGATYSRMHEAQLRAKTGTELQQAIDDYTRRQQDHTENDRPILAAAAGRKIERAKRIKAEREAEERTRIGNTPTDEEEYCPEHGAVTPVDDDGIAKCPNCDRATSTTPEEAERFMHQDD